METINFDDYDVVIRGNMNPISFKKMQTIQNGADLINKSLKVLITNFHVNNELDKLEMSREDYFEEIKS